MANAKADMEEEIVGLFRRGDSSAMDRLYAAHAPYLTAVCARYIADEDALKDVLQEALIKIFTQIDSFCYRGRGSLRAWMTRIVVNESLQALRRHRRQPVMVTDADAPDLPDEDPEVDSIDADALTQLIRQLPEGYRTVLNLYAIEGHSHKEIAQLLGIKPDTSASQFHRAKNMLAKLIKDYRRTKV